MKPVLKINFKDRGSIALLPDGTWQPSDEDLAILAKTADNLTSVYEYSPSQGAWGFALATGIAKRLGGELVLPEQPTVEKEPDDGVVF